jgi:hypothetical protein
MHSVVWKLGAPILLLAAGAAVHAAAQSVPEPPAGTIAAEMKERAGSAASHGGLIEVTAVSTTLIAFDKNGRAVLDLRPEELMVLEDGEPVKLLALDPGLAAEETEATRAPVMTDAGATLGSPQAPARPWRVVIYVSTELAGRFVLPALCRRIGGEATRMTDLGPVEVVLADPTPTLLVEAGRRPDAVRQALEQVAREASGVTTVEQIRNAFMRDFKPGVGFDVRYSISQSSPMAFAAKAQASVHRERTVIRGELDRMVAWMQSQPPTARGLLVWMTGGFDLNPADFYIPLVEQIDPNMAMVLRSDYSMLSLEKDVRQMVEVALAYGWTMMPINTSRTNFVYGAEVGGTGKVQHLQGVEASSISSLQSEFRQVAPNFPLQIIAQSTGGEFVANDAQLERALDHIRGAYLVTYQVDRPVDGELHRLEIRCTRPGVRLRGRRYAASGSLRGVSTTRAQRLLSGDEIAGSLAISANVHNIIKVRKGLRLGDLDVNADLGRLRPLLNPLDLGQIRVTVVVEIENGPPFIHHQEIAVDWGQMADQWQFRTDIKWPKKAKRMAVVVEELVTSTWGATTVELR